MPEMKPESYREQDGCWNCKKVYKHVAIDDPHTWVCSVGESPRPSITKDIHMMRKQPSDAEWETFFAERIALNDWIYGGGGPNDDMYRTHTNPWGTCDEWEKDDE